MTAEALPYAHTRAASMLKDALARYTAQQRGGLRALVARFEMKQATVLSHMATGRIGIPLDRAEQFARVLDMNVEEFCLAVLEQREPQVFALLGDAYGFTGSVARAEIVNGLVRELLKVDSVTSQQASAIRAILSDKIGSSRIVSGRMGELVGVIREVRPEGLSDAEWDKLIAVAKAIL